MKDKYFEITITIEQKDDCKRIDQFLFDYFLNNNISEKTIGLVLSRSKIQNFISNGNILINDIIVKQSYVVKQNDIISIRIPLEYGDKLKINPEKIYFEILYNDESLCVINKPIGLVVHPSHGHFNQTLINGLVYLFPNLKKNTNLYRMGLVHRLDKDTSGVLVITKNEAAQFNLINQFKDNAEKSKYYSFKLIENDPYFLYKKIEECKQINNDMKGSITYKVGNLIIRYQRYIKKYFLKFLKSQ